MGQRRWVNIVPLFPCVILMLDQCRLPTVDYNIKWYNGSEYRGKWKYSWQKVSNGVAIGWLMVTTLTLGQRCW